MRIGLLGGSFDPPHIGHLIAASDAFEALALDRLLFIPAATQPLKRDARQASPAQRLAMVRLLVAGDARFDVSDVEVERGGLSYTVDTLSTLAADWPGAALFLLIGADLVPDLAKWREPGAIAELSTIAVLSRGEGPVAANGIPVRELATRRVDVSSSEVRRRVAEGKSIHGFVPDAVAEFIAAERLYR